MCIDGVQGHKVGERGAHWLADALRAKTIGIGQLVLSVRLSILLSGVMVRVSKHLRLLCTGDLLRRACSDAI